MKNKKGFTVVELIVSFALTMTVAVFLFQIVIILKNLYNNSGLKTELLNKQALISNKMNTSFNEKGINLVTKCGSYCINFIYDDGTSEKLLIDYEKNKIEFGTYTTVLPNKSYFGEVLIDVVYSGTFGPSSNNALLDVKIPIYNDDFKEQNFGVNIVYQFNHLYSNIYTVNFDSQTSDYGYIQLMGSKNISILDTQAYAELGYKVFDANGKEVSGIEVIVENPLTALSLPYPAGEYEIKYILKKDNIDMYIIKRKVTVVRETTTNATNLLSNASFENTGWSSCIYSTAYKKYGNYSCQLNGTTASSEIVAVNSTSIPLDNSHIYYSRIEGYQTTKTGTLSWQTYWPIAEPSFGLVYFGAAGQWNMYSLRIGRSSFTNGSYPLRFDFDNRQNASTVYYDGGMLIDLTTTFGAGKEPSKEWCDKNIPFFEGTSKIPVP